MCVPRQPELALLNGLQHAANLLEECNRSERIGKHRAGKHPLGLYPRDKQYGRWRAENGKVVSEFQAIYMGQQNVGHDKIELPIQRAGDRQCFFARRRRKGNEALGSQGLSQDAAEHRVIFNNQNDLFLRRVGRHEITCPELPKPGVGSDMERDLGAHTFEVLRPSCSDPSHVRLPEPRTDCPSVRPPRLTRPGPLAHNIRPTNVRALTESGGDAREPSG
jgi:hypothetical protein